MKRLVSEEVEVFRWENYGQQEVGNIQGILKTGYKGEKKVILEIPNNLSEADLVKMLNCVKKRKPAFMYREKY